MRAVQEWIQYLAISAGMALAVSCFTVLAGLFDLVASHQVVWVVLAAGVLCFIVALSVAELAARFPSAPGVRTYLRAAFGDRFSLSFTFMYLAMLALVAGVESVALGRVANLIFPQLPAMLFPILTLGIVLLINSLGMELSRKVQTISAGLMVAGLTTIAIGVLLHQPAVTTTSVETAVSNKGDWLAIAGAVGIAFFLFTGFEWVTPLGRSARSYQRQIPLAMLGAVIMLGLMYSLFSAAMGRISVVQLLQSPAPHVMTAQWGLAQTGVVLALGLSVLAVFTSFNTGIMGASRLIYGIAREGHLPRWCAYISLRTTAPIGALIFVGSLALGAIVLIVGLQAHMAAAAVSATIVALTYASLMMANIYLRQQSKAAKAGFFNPFPHSIQIIICILTGLLGCAAIATEPMTQVPLLLLVLFISAVSAHHSVTVQHATQS